MAAQQKDLQSAHKRNYLGAVWYEVAAPLCSRNTWSCHIIQEAANECSDGQTSPNITKCCVTSWIDARPHICAIDKSMMSHPHTRGTSCWSTKGINYANQRDHLMTHQRDLLMTCWRDQPMTGQRNQTQWPAEPHSLLFPHFPSPHCNSLIDQNQKHKPLQHLNW